MLANPSPSILRPIRRELLASISHAAMLTTWEGGR